MSYQTYWHMCCSAHPRALQSYQAKAQQPVGQIECGLLAGQLEEVHLLQKRSLCLHLHCQTSHATTHVALGFTLWPCGHVKAQQHVGQVGCGLLAGQLE